MWEPLCYTWITNNLLLGKAFFPNTISGLFKTGLYTVFYLATVLCIIAAVTSLLHF